MVSLGILVIIALIVLYLWATYNSLITAKTRVEESWSGIDVQLKRRASLIPNLVETVKGYASHEREIFEEVSKARSALVNASTPQEKAQADNTLSGTLKTLFAVAENYPDLKANENFIQLQEELADAEDKVAYARQFYNTNVMEYNIKLKVFPSVLVANLFSFKPEEFFEAEESERKDVKVDFTSQEA